MSATLTVDDFAKAISIMSKQGYSAQQVSINFSKVFNKLLKAIKIEITLQDSDRVNIWDYEMEEFERLYKYHPSKCKNRQDFIAKIAVIRL